MFLIILSNLRVTGVIKTVKTWIVGKTRRESGHLFSTKVLKHEGCFKVVENLSNFNLGF